VGSKRTAGGLEANKQAVRAVAWSPDGSQLVSGSQDRTLRIWDAGTGRALREVAAQGEVWDASWSPDGGAVAAAVDSAARVWEASGKRRHTLEYGAGRQVRGVAWLAGGKALAVG